MATTTSPRTNTGVKYQVPPVAVRLGRPVSPLPSLTVTPNDSVMFPGANNDFPLLNRPGSPTLQRSLSPPPAQRKLLRLGSASDINAPFGVERPVISVKGSSVVSLSPLSPIGMTENFFPQRQLVPLNSEAVPAVTNLAILESQAHLPSIRVNKVNTPSRLEKMKKAIIHFDYPGFFSRLVSTANGRRTLFCSAGAIGGAVVTGVTRQWSLVAIPALLTPVSIGGVMKVAANEVE